MGAAGVVYNPSMPLALPDCEILLHEQAILLAVWRKKIILQHRSGELTLEHIERILPRIQHLARSNRPFGAFLVVAAGAPVPSERVRAEQKKFIQLLTSNPLGRVAVVNLGDNVQSGLSRSVSRLLALQHTNIQTFSDCASAATWLGAQLDALGLPSPPEELGRTYEALARR